MKRALLVLLPLLVGCESLPHDGPSARGLATEAATSQDYSVVDLDYRVAQVVAANPPRELSQLQAVQRRASLDLIGPGDTLQVNIYQTLPLAGAASASEKNGDGSISLSNVQVDRSGGVLLPYAGRIQVAGLTPQQAAGLIEQALRGRMVNPQVVVAVASNLANSVTVIGEARTAGRFPLSANGDYLLDIIAAAGGATKPPADVQVTLVRGSESRSSSLAALMADPSQNIQLSPHDQIRLIYQPRKFSTFGALAKSAQVTIEDDHLSLASAISRMGGLDPNAADAKSVLVFRLERPDVAKALGLAVVEKAPTAPIIYRLNMREPSGYFVANNFEVRAEDLIYVPRSDAAELRKFFELVSTVSRVAYDVRVTSVLR